MKVRKFEKSFELKQSGILEYEFLKSWPKAISSMPVTYDSSSLLKTTVSMTYVRYVINNLDQNISAQATKPPGGFGNRQGNRNQPNQNPWVNFAADALEEFGGVHVPDWGRDLANALF